MLGAPSFAFMKRTAFALLALVLTLVPCHAVAEDYGSALQKLHVAKVGYALGDGRLSSVSYTETQIGKDGKTISTTSVHRLGVLYRSDLHDKKSGNDASVGFTGNLFWYSDINGFTVPMLGDSAQIELTYDLIDSDAVATLPWTFERMENVNGTTLAVIRVTHEHALAIDLYVDPTTGLYKRVVIDPKGDYERTLDYQEYTSASSGVALIHKWKFADSDVSHVISEITVNPAIDAQTLHPPAQTAHWEFRNGAPFPIELRKDRVVVHAKVNGVEGTFLLDTGASNIVLSGAFARRAGLRASGHSEIGGPEVDEKVDTGIADSIEVGGNVLHNAHVYFGTQELDYTAPDGELGFDLLAGAIVSLDMGAHTMQIAESSDEVAAGLPGIHVQADLSGGSPVVPMKVGSSITLNALLDTGAPREMLISWGAPAHYGLHFVGGVCGNLDDLKLGPIVFKTPGACLGEMSWRDAIVGIRFFRGFQTVTFDYQHSQLVFVPEKKH